MPALRPIGLVVVVALSALMGAPSCSQKQVEPEGTYFDRKIAPILTGSCATSPTASLCHVTADDRGNALGNLDVSSYEMLSKRQDLFADYGPYGMPQLLVKVVPPQTIEVDDYDGKKNYVTTDIPHAGGSIFDTSSAGFQAVQKWVERGHTKNNSTPAPVEVEKEPCSDQYGKDALFDPTKDPPNADYKYFVDNVNPWISANCSAKNCHGSLQLPFPITCGTSDEQKRWNYFTASDYTHTDPMYSELLRRTVPTGYGGTYHPGGKFLKSPDDAQYKKVLEWVKQHGPPTNIPQDPGFDMFARRVQPMLVKKGCILMGCHSPPSFNEFHPRAPSGGHFGVAATRFNYETTLNVVALESPDPNASRILRKNLEPGPKGLGMRHRGGSLLSKGGDPLACDFDAAENGPLDDQDPYCVIAAWIAKERAERLKNLPPLSGIVYVKRPFTTDNDFPQDYEVYRPGADLRWIDAGFNAQNEVETSGGDKSLMAGCGLDPATADVRRPAVAWDGSKIGFAARSSASEPYQVYIMNADGSSCAPDPLINAAPTDTAGAPLDTKGALIHNFDPAFAPNGAIVFTSTRGYIFAGHPLAGPTHSAADPSKLNASMYVLEDDGSGGKRIRQLTFLSNQELFPGFEYNGQVLMTTEKRAPDFYQLASRRINLDGGDYHPNFGQRASVGYLQLTEVGQGLDRNFFGIASDRGAKQLAGTLVVINRSLGPDNVSQNPDDYAEEPDAIDYANTKFFQRSFTIVDPAATGRVGQTTQGAYRNPSGLPNANILVSYAANVVDLENINGNFDVVVVNPVTRQRTPLAGLNDPNADEIWPVAVYGRVSRGVFLSSPADPITHSRIYPDKSDRFQLTVVDFPMIASLLFQNTRGSRRVQTDMDSFEAWAGLPPDAAGVKSLDDQSPFIGSDKYGKYFAARVLVGKVPLLEDGSVRVAAPAGFPVVVAIKAPLQTDGGKAALHHHREELQFYPGEFVTLSLRRQMFGNFCGGCHGPPSGKEFDVSVKPDIISVASKCQATKDKDYVVDASDPKPVLDRVGAGDIAGPADIH